MVQMLFSGIALVLVSGEFQSHMVWIVLTALPVTTEDCFLVRLHDVVKKKKSFHNYFDRYRACDRIHNLWELHFFGSQFFFTLNLMYYNHNHVNIFVVYKKHVLLHVENKKCWQQHLCSITALYYNDCRMFDFFIKRYCSLCKLDVDF